MECTGKPKDRDERIIRTGDAVRIVSRICVDFPPKFIACSARRRLSGKPLAIRKGDNTMTRIIGVLALALVVFPLSSFGYDWVAPCDTIKPSTIEDVLDTNPSVIRGLSEDDYFSAECHIFDDKYTYVGLVKLYVLMVMRLGTVAQAKRAKNILREMASEERKILPRVFGGVPISNERARDLRRQITDLNAEIGTTDFKVGTPLYLESDGFWKYFTGK